MAFIKQAILLVLLLFCTKSNAQIKDVTKPSRQPPSISVFKNYFSPNYLDSTFIRKHGIKSITTKESLIINDSLIYHKPQYVFTYAKNGHQRHFEYNSWNADGGCVSNYRDEYGDSTLSVNHSYRVRNDSVVRDSKTCFTTYYIDDTLSRRIRYNYSFDSLVKIVDNGIYDSKALERDRKKKARIRDTSNSTMSVNISSLRLEKKSMCILPPIEMRFEDPKPKIIKDSLGRITETYASIYIYMDNLRPLVPYQNTVITYLDSTTIIKSCLSYLQFNRDQFEKTILETPKGEQRDYPLCDSEYCLNYQLLASNFILGIPQNIIIIKREKTLKYTTVIAFW